ncbi:TolC family protein [Xylanibacter rarus]|uniref:TolC family protein n=3 Tax=Prevotellaceae TaxID=171552 RepID=UPI003AB99DD6
MLELPKDTEILPDTTLLSSNMPKPGEAEFQDIAYKNSPILNKNRLALDMLSKKEKVIKSGYMPQISIIAGDNLKGPITYEIPVLDNNINTWYVGVGLKFNIGNIYKLPKDLSRLRSSVEQSHNELASAEESVSLDVNAAYTRYLDSFELLKTQEKSLQLARENYDVIANRYANDLVLVTDLVDADNLRLSAEVQYVNAQINVIYNYYKLIYSTGSLNTIIK